MNKILLGLLLAGFISSASAVYYEENVTVEFRVLPETMELRVVGDGVAEFLPCNTTCHTTFKVSGFVDDNCESNLTKVQYSIHSAIADARDVVLRGCNLTQTCSLGGVEDRINSLGQNVSKLGSVYASFQGNESTYEELEDRVDDCLDSKALLQKDYDAEVAKNAVAQKDISELKAENKSVMDLLWIMVAVTIFSVAWATGIIKMFMRKKG